MRDVLPVSGAGHSIGSPGWQSWAKGASYPVPWCAPLHHEANGSGCRAINLEQGPCAPSGSVRAPGSTVEAAPDGGGGDIAGRRRPSCGSVTAASAAPLPPAAGVSPAVVAGGIGPIYFYTAANGTVWTKTETGAATQVSNGKVVGAVSGLFNGSSIILFGVGTDHALWFTTGSGTNWSSWASLGGSITAQPAAVYRGSAAVYSVFARGTNGVVWARDHSSAGWGAWHSEGGYLYGGTGPSAAYFGGITYILVAGTNKQLYLAEAGLTGFKPVGGLTTATPALTTAPGALAGFVRGTTGSRTSTGS